MVNVSNAFLERIQYYTRFKPHAVITLEDDTVLNLGEEDFAIEENNLTDGAGSNTFPLGVAIERCVTLELMNDQGQYSEVSFLGASIRIYITLDLDDTGSSTEGVECGTFTVTEPESYGETVILTAIDDMWRTDRPVSTSLPFPIPAYSLLQDICMSTGIILGDSMITNGGFEIHEAPKGNLTFRQVIGYIAMIAGGNARIDRNGRLRIITYDFNFNQECFELSSFSHLKTGLDDVVITGVKTEDTNETEILAGTEGYVLSLSNPLWTGHEQTAMTLIGGILIGGTFRDFDGDHTACPILEFMDKVTVVDRKGNRIHTILTDVEFKFTGSTTIKNSAESAARNSSKYNSAAVQTLVKAKQLIASERTQRETAIENLARELSASTGLYPTSETTPGGGTIYYLHDKPTLAESETVIKLNSEALGISLDGGVTYPYGLDFSGDAILHKIYAIGIEAEHIVVGSGSESRSMTDVIDVMENDINEAKEATITGIITHYLATSSGSGVTRETAGWTTTIQTVSSTDKYLWTYDTYTYGDGSTDDTEPVITGVYGDTGNNGEDATVLNIDSSRGVLFKHNVFASTLTVTIYKGTSEIKTKAAMRAAYGAGAYLQWYWRKSEDEDWHVISSEDSHLSNDSFVFTVTPADVDEKIVFKCELIV